LGKLITKSENELREEHISLELKTIVSDHTVKIGVIIGVNLRFASKQNYKDNIYSQIK